MATQGATGVRGKNAADHLNYSGKVIQPTTACDKGMAIYDKCVAFAGEGLYGSLGATRLGLSAAARANARLAASCWPRRWSVRPIW